MKSLRVLIFDRREILGGGKNAERFRTHLLYNYNKSKTPFLLTVDTSENLQGIVLPKDYDGYVIHPSNTTLEEISKLRELNPHAVIYVRTGYGYDELNPQLREIINGCFEGLSTDEVLKEREEFFRKLKVRGELE